jgi:endoglucanase Acf2
MSGRNCQVLIIEAESTSEIWPISSTLHSATLQKTVIFVLPIVRTLKVTPTNIIPGTPAKLEFDTIINFAAFNMQKIYIHAYVHITFHMIASIIHHETGS